jgi:hypothetical protein
VLFVKESWEENEFPLKSLDVAEIAANRQKIKLNRYSIKQATNLLEILK